MGKSYSQDLRERVIAAMDGGGKAYKLAPLFRVSVSYIYKVLGRRRATGETTARRWAGGPKPKLADQDESLRQRVAAVPYATLAELQAWLRSERGVAVSIGCLWKRLQHLDLTLKKSRRGRPNRIGRTSPRLVRNGAPARPS